MLFSPCNKTILILFVEVLILFVEVSNVRALVVFNSFPLHTALIASKMNKHLSHAQSLRLNRDEEHERQLDEWAA